MRISGLHGMNSSYVGIELEDRSDIAQLVPHYYEDKFTIIEWVIYDHFIRLMETWIFENIIDHYTSEMPIEHHDGVPIWKFWFKSEEDAVGFKLRWC